MVVQDGSVSYNAFSNIHTLATPAAAAAAAAIGAVSIGFALVWANSNVKIPALSLLLHSKKIVTSLT